MQYTLARRRVPFNLGYPSVLHDNLSIRRRVLVHSVSSRRPRGSRVVDMKDRWRNRLWNTLVMGGNWSRRGVDVTALRYLTVLSICATVSPLIAREDDSASSFVVIVFLGDVILAVLLSLQSK